MQEIEERESENPLAYPENKYEYELEFDKNDKY
jgi:hypothetical protein